MTEIHYVTIDLWLCDDSTSGLATWFAEWPVPGQGYVSATDRRLRRLIGRVVLDIRRTEPGFAHGLRWQLFNGTNHRRPMSEFITAAGATLPTWSHAACTKSVA